MSDFLLAIKISVGPYLVFELDTTAFAEVYRQASWAASSPEVSTYSRPVAIF